jgi:hypothetical protein
MLARRLPPGLQVEPGALEQAKLLPGPAKQEQTKGSQNKDRRQGRMGQTRHNEANLTTNG